MSSLSASRLHHRNRHNGNKRPGKQAAVVAPSETVFLNALEKNTLIKVSANDPLALSSKTQNDIIVPPNLVGNLLGMTLQFTCTNNTNANITFPTWGAIDMIDYIDELLDGQRTPLVKHMKETLLFSMRYLAPDEIITYKRGFMPPSSGVLAPGASYIFYIPFLNDPLVLNNVFMMSFNELITYRIWFSPSSWPGAIPTISNLSLIARHSMPVNSELALLRNSYASSIMRFPFHQYIEQNFSRAIGPSDTVSLDLTQFKAGVSDIMVYVRPAGSVVVGDLTQYIDQYSLQDSASVAIMGLAQVDVPYYNSIMCATHKIRSVINPAVADPWLGIALSSDVAGDYKTGSVSGYYFFTGTEKLVLKFKSSITAGTYVITCIQGRIQELFLDRGNVVLKKN